MRLVKFNKAYYELRGQYVDPRSRNAITNAIHEDKIKDTKLGAWLKDKAPSVLDTVGELLPDKGALEAL